MTAMTAIQSACLSAPLGHYMLTASARLMVDRQTRQEPAASTETDISTSSGTTGERGSKRVASTTNEERGRMREGV